MRIKSIEWKAQRGQYSNGKDAFIGKVKVGSIGWNGIDRDTNLRYIAYSKLPSVKDQLGKYPTEQEAMNEVERITKVWFDEATS